MNDEAKLKQLECLHGCIAPVIGVYYFRDGTFQFPDKIQALCAEHSLEIDSERLCLLGEGK